MTEKKVDAEAGHALSTNDGHPEKETPAEADDELGPSAEDATADALKGYPRDRYEAALNGEVSLTEFAQDVLRHVQSQLPRSRRPATSSLAPIRRRVHR